MISSESVNKITWTIVTLVVLFVAMGVLMPELSDAGDSINNTDNCDWNGSAYVNCSQPPLYGIFAGGGIIMLIIMAGFLFTVFYKIQEIKSFFGK